MRWNKPPSNSNAKREVIRFAWFPVKLTSGMLIWLESYRRIQQWSWPLGEWLDLGDYGLEEE